MTNISYTAQIAVTVMPCSLHSIAVATDIIEIAKYFHAVDADKIIFYFNVFFVVFGVTNVWKGLNNIIKIYCEKKPREKICKVVRKKYQSAVKWESDMSALMHYEWQKDKKLDIEDQKINW